MHNTCHKHTAYVMANADMPVFSRVDQELIALLALVHQGKLHKLESVVRTYSQWIALLCLRLSVLLFRRREDISPLTFSLSVQNTSIVIRVSREWLAAHPLSDFTLRNEESEWRKVGF